MGEYVALSLYPVLARCAVLLRIRSLHLIHTYRWFAAYVLAGLLQEGAWLRGYPGDPRYGVWWANTAPLVIATSIAAVLELWKLTMSRYPGVKRIYSWLVPAVIVICAAGTILTAFDFWAIDWRPTIYRIALLAYRYTEAPLAIGCAFLLGWIIVFPERAPKNVKVHAVALTGNLATIAVGNAVIVLSHGYNLVAGPLMAIASVSFLLLWALCMSPGGERLNPPPPPGDDEIARVRARERELLNVRRFLRFRP